MSKGEWPVPSPARASDELPRGTVTFLYTDVEGSTRLWEQQPEAMRAALARHDAILRAAIKGHQGVIFRTGGDAFSAAFESGPSAVAAAVVAQHALAAEEWPTADPLWVRVVIHTTEAEVRDGDYVGSGLNLVGRLLDVCHGGQTLITATTAELVRGHLPDGVEVRDLGEHRLKDLRSPRRLFQLVLAGLPVDFPPLRSLDGTPNNLPVQMTSFIGRERELGELVELLAHPDPFPRLITLTGPGGTGKTRLSLYVAAETLELFPDGAWLVELAALSEPQLVVQAVASVFSLREPVGRPLQALVIDYLRRRKLLLILDNCEHLIDECARLADDLLRTCPNLRILASSREALGIAGERAYRVPSLPLPPAHVQACPDDLCDYPAVRLFQDRAEAVRPGFALTGDNCGAIVQICRRLDGIPLAIELAAARTRVLSPDQIAERLDDRFRLLTGGSRTALPRQRTLQALIDWSYDLLSEPERTLLRRLSVFSGGWSLEAAEAVGSGDGLEKHEVLDLLDQLVSKSLVTAEEHPLGMRYRMLETVRQYAQQKLIESGEAMAARDRHLAYFVDMTLQARQSTDALRDVQGWVERLKLEVDNLRATRAWALEHDLRAAVQLVSSITIGWSSLYQALEIQRFIEAVLVRAETDPAYGPDGSSEDRRLFAAALFSACIVAFGLGQDQKSLELALRSAKLARDMDDQGVLAMALALAASAFDVVGDHQLARQYREESRTLSRQSGNRLALAMSLTGLIATFTADPGEDQGLAWAEWHEGMAMLREGEAYWALGLGYQVAAIARIQHGDMEQARYYAEQSLLAYEVLDDVQWARIPRSILAELDLRSGELLKAAEAFRELLPSWRDSGNPGAVARCLELLAFISRARAQQVDDVAAAGLLDQAATLLGAGEAIRVVSGADMRAVERTEHDAELAALRSQMDEPTLAAAWARGRAMGLDEAVDWAVEIEGNTLQP